LLFPGYFSQFVVVFEIVFALIFPGIPLRCPSPARCLVRPADAQNSYGELMRLAIQASTIVSGMAIPGLIGGYLDFKFGTRYGVLIGIGLGMVVGTIQLLALARSRSTPRKGGEREVDEDPDRDAGA
jgi:hypothetical protein